MNWTAAAAIALGLAVALGAFGAHGLRTRLDSRLMEIYETGVLYHFIHALGLLIVSILPKAGVLSQPGASWVCVLLTAGIVVFSGSLYLLAVTGVRIFGAITPIGGVSFIAAWALLAYLLLRSPLSD